MRLWNKNFLCLIEKIFHIVLVLWPCSGRFCAVETLTIEQIESYQSSDILFMICTHNCLHRYAYVCRQKDI